MFRNLTEDAPDAPVLLAVVGSSSAGPTSRTEVIWSKPGPRRVGKRTPVLVGTLSEHSAQELLRLVRLDEEQIIKMDMLIGPLLERNGGYGYDTFTVAEGPRSSFRYLRLEAARYDQRALIAEARRDPRCNVRICETLAEFEQSVEAAQHRDAPTAEGEWPY